MLFLLCLGFAFLPFCFLLFYPPAASKCNKISVRRIAIATKYVLLMEAVCNS